MTTPSDDSKLWADALTETVKNMTPAQRRALVESVTDDTFKPSTDPDPAVRQKALLQSIANKQAKAPRVDNNGQPIEGQTRWGRTQ